MDNLVEFEDRNFQGNFEGQDDTIARGFLEELMAEIKLCKQIWNIEMRKDLAYILMLQNIEINNNAKEDQFFIFWIYS